MSSVEEEAARAQRMERKTDPQKPIEANLPSGEGLVYILREPSFSTTITLEDIGGVTGIILRGIGRVIGDGVQIKANGKPVVSLETFSYFPFSVPAGDVKFTIDPTNDPTNTMQNDPTNIMQNAPEREIIANIKVKPGYVYYLRVYEIPPPPSWTFSLVHLPYQGGADIIESYKMTQIKK